MKYVTAAITEYSATEAGLADLRQRFKGAQFDCSTPAGLKAAKEARLELVKLRTSLEAMRVEIKAPVIERGRLIDAEAKRITAELVALEEPIDQQIKAEEARKEAERKAREEAERERVQKIHARIATIAGEVARAAGHPAAQIALRIEVLRTHELQPGNYDEFLPQAQATLADVLVQLDALHQRQLAHEAEQARIIAEREELARLRAENEARLAAERKAADEAAAAERARLAAEREEQERQLAEARAAAEAEAAAERARLDEERRQMEEAHRVAMAAIPAPIEIVTVEEVVPLPALIEGSQPPARNATAVIDGQIATVRIENGTPPELVIEDDTDRAIVQLSPGIAREIIEKLSTYLLATDRGVQS